MTSHCRNRAADRGSDQGGVEGSRGQTDDTEQVTQLSESLL
jgi:hypothetical protein